MERLYAIKEALINCAQGQMSHLQDVDAKELGAVIDMIKDLEESIYYCTITDSMNEKQNEDMATRGMRNYYPNRDMDRSSGRMYFDDKPAMGGMTPKYYTETMPKEGRSGATRKMYMEGKEKHQDKTYQLQELEKYMNELGTDLVDMIEDSSPEEKQYLERKIAQLAEKISHV